MTERAQRSGRANAASGRIMVTVPNDHFGPILPEHDPENGKVRCAASWTCDLVIWQVHAFKQGSVACMAAAASTLTFTAILYSCAPRACSWATGGRTAWTAASGARTSPTSRASPASPTSARRCVWGRGGGGGCVLTRQLRHAWSTWSPLLLLSSADAAAAAADLPWALSSAQQLMLTLVIFLHAVCGAVWRL